MTRRASGYGVILTSGSRFAVHSLAFEHGLSSHVAFRYLFQLAAILCLKIADQVVRLACGWAPATVEETEHKCQ